MDELNVQPAVVTCPVELSDHEINWAYGLSDERLAGLPLVSEHNEPQLSPQEYECGCITVARITDRDYRRDEKPFEMRLARSCGTAACELVSAAAHVRMEAVPMSQICHQRLVEAGALDAWQPCDGHALVTCKIQVRGGVHEAWESRTYEFRRTSKGTWSIDTNPGLLIRDSWEGVVGWFCYMRPVEIDLVTTV